jgi:phosphodiesterase/alkaline phosphatase D-like protein
LEPFGTYHYRLVAIDAAGKGFPAYGRDRTFTPSPEAPPAIDATGASDETPTTATLSASINPNLAPTLFRFQYGTDSNYDAQTSQEGPIGEDGVDHPVSVPIAGLTPGTTYHFRVVAFNIAGQTAGPDETFNTPDAPRVLETASSGVTQTRANLTAQLRAGFRSTTYRFEYGTSTSYGYQTTDSGLIGADDSSRTVRTEVTALNPSTTYHYRVVARNAIGTTLGPDETFTTAPVETTPTRPHSRCKKGFVKRHGKCVRHRKRRHHMRRHHG